MSDPSHPQNSSYGETLLESGKFSDVSIRTATRIIKAHKCILASLPFFAKTFEFNSGNFGSCNEIDMSEDDEWHVDMLLKYLYVSMNEYHCLYSLEHLDAPREQTYETLLSFYFMADKYGVDGLLKAAIHDLRDKMEAGLQKFDDRKDESDPGNSPLFPIQWDDIAALAINDNLGGDDTGHNVHDVAQSSKGKEKMAKEEHVDTPLMDLIDRIYDSEATDLYRRLRRQFLNNVMYRHITNHLWKNEEVQKMLSSPDSELCYEVVGALAARGHVSSDCRRRGRDCCMVGPQW